MTSPNVSIGNVSIGASHQPGWQGSAFALDKNVASPSEAPTSCLKVRNLFSDRQKAQGPDWVWQVKEEILRRCTGGLGVPARILHIAVDQESTDGCVYIKCMSTDDAGKVFKTLHGQWYRGALVTAKYLREERYNERFPGSRNQTEPLLPQT